MQEDGRQTPLPDNRGLRKKNEPNGDIDGDYSVYQEADNNHQRVM